MKGSFSKIKILTDLECRGRECDGQLYWDGMYDDNDYMFTCEKCDDVWILNYPRFSFEIIVVDEQ